MSRGGAPTGKWDTAPKHLDAEEEIDFRTAEVRLTVRRPGVPEVEIPVEKSTFVIGRLASEVDLVLDDELVSRRHARLTTGGRGYFRLEDMSSQNGIRFKERAVRRLNLVDGDVFHIGKTEFVFHAKMDRFGGTPPKGTPVRRESEVEIPTPVVVKREPEHHDVASEPGTDGADGPE